MTASAALACTGALVLVAVLAGLIWRARDGRIRSAAADSDVTDLAVEPGRITLVQFSTETCARCPQVRRMLHAEAAAHPGIRVLDVDLTHRPDLAARHRVLSTPTVFLIDRTQRVVARFVGVPRPAELRTALDALPLAQEA